MNATEVQRQNAEQERKDRLHFAAFVDTRVSKDILDGSEEVFGKTTREFEVDLRSHMLQVATGV